MKTSFGAIFTHGEYEKLHKASTFLNDHNPQFLITLCITIRDEHDDLFDPFHGNYNLHLMINSTFAEYVSYGEQEHFKPILPSLSA